MDRRLDTGKEKKKRKTTTTTTKKQKKTNKNNRTSLEASLHGRYTTR